MRVDPAHGRDTLLDRVVPRRLRADRRGLGHAVADGDIAHADLVDQPAHDLDRTGRAADHAGAQRGHVEAREFGMVELGDEHRGHAAEDVQRSSCDGLQHGERIETFAGIDHGGAVGHADQAADTMPKQWYSGTGMHIPIAGGDAACLAR